MTEESSREQTLQDFQDCTGLENMEECIHILDEHEWNLMTAIQSVHERIGTNNSEQESTVPVQILPNRNKRQTSSNDFDDPDELRIIKTIPGGQRGTVRELYFTVNFNDQTELIIAFDNETVYKLREKIAEKFSIQPSKQYFTNWVLKSYDDQTILKDLELPKENDIHLSSIENNSTTQTTSSSQSSIEIPLTIISKDKEQHEQTHKIVVPSNATIADLKQRIENLTQIPVREQSWQGLLGAKDSEQLHQTSITSQSKLIVSSAPLDDDQMEVDHETGVEIVDDNDVTILSENTSNREPLIPDDCPDDFTALEHFQQVFHRRYGSTGPIFYIGPLDQAIQDSLHTSIHNRRPLAIYLHSDNSVCRNIFCSQVLSADSIIEYLVNNYLFWAWDVTSPINKAKLIEVLRRCIGNQGAQRVNELDDQIFPLILIVSRTRGALELVNIIEGRSTPSEVLSNLIQSHESFEQQRVRDIDEELVRERRETLKKQQEDEYEQSRQADLAKERARQEEQDTNERLKQQRLQLQQESKARLPDEPNEIEKNLTTLKIRLPDDDGVLIRRFRTTDNLQILFDYLTSEGRMFGDYKLLTTYPKRDLTSVDPSQTFEQLKLYPQEQLILEIL